HLKRNPCNPVVLVYPVRRMRRGDSITDYDSHLDHSRSVRTHPTPAREPSDTPSFQAMNKGARKRSMQARAPTPLSCQPLATYAVSPAPQVSAPQTHGRSSG